MRLRNDKNRKNGSDVKFKIANLPQPCFYLYHIRLRDMKKVNNGSDDIIKNKDPPQPYYYIYNIS